MALARMPTLPMRMKRAQAENIATAAHDHADTTRVELIEKHAGGEGAWHEEEARPRAEVDGIGGMR